MTGRAEVLVATSWDCNLRCSYCFVQAHSFGRGGLVLDAAAARRLVDALDAGLADAESISIHLYGGEPLLHLAPIRAMVEQAATKAPGRFGFAVTTNGTVDTDEAIALLGRGRFEVILSIDGPAAVHDQCRRTTAGAPSHRRVLRFLERLRGETDCWVRGSAVVRADWSLAQADAYLRSLPVDAIKAQAIRVPAGSAHALDGGERAAYLQDLDALGEHVIDDLEHGRVPADDRYSSRVLQLLKGEPRQRFCGAGTSVFGVTPQGELRPCLLVEGESLGHIDDDPRAWRAAGERWRAARGPRAECAACEALPLCGGGCPAMLAVCGADECDLVRHNCRVARRIYDRFRARPEKLLALAGIV